MKLNKPLLRSAISITVTGAVDLFMWPWYSSIMLPTLMTHEVGHYLTGYMSGASVEPPILVPLGPITLGLTKVENPSRPKLVAIAGPVYGILASGTIFLTLAMMDLAVIFLPFIFIISMFQLSGLVLGSDAKRFANST